MRYREGGGESQEESVEDGKGLQKGDDEQQLFVGLGDRAITPTQMLEVYRKKNGEGNILNLIETPLDDMLIVHNSGPCEQNVMNGFRMLHYKKPRL